MTALTFKSPLIVIYLGYSKGIAAKFFTKLSTTQMLSLTLF
jgi:hypothetical protein